MTETHAPPRRGVVFVSYAKGDAEAGDRLVRALSAAGFEVLTSESPSRTGELWAAGIQELIAKADVVVILISRASIRSEFVQVESAAALASAARRDDLVLLPVLLGPDVDPPAILAPLVHFRVKSPFELDRVAELASEAVGRARMPRSAQREVARQQLELTEQALKAPQVALAAKDVGRHTLLQWLLVFAIVTTLAVLTIALLR